MPRRSVRRACEGNAGNILFLRRSQNRSPCICIQQPDSNVHDASGSELPIAIPLVWRWVAFTDLDSENFLKYRIKISEYIKKLQSDARSMQNEEFNPEFLYVPSPMERALVRQIFNNHLSDEEKRRYIVEFSNTIVGESTCFKCLNITENKEKCLYFDCPGMCLDCYETMTDHCPACEKEQKIICPVCKEEKIAEEVCHHKSTSRHPIGRCGHPICWTCLGKSYAVGKSITKCPLCRCNWLSAHVRAVSPVHI